uniref:Chalcone-flavonone isomerase family protein n=1 Tax=Tanacetum cinerariifolium TaxID=118510 RepID=A0A6L2P7M0_TANCI|nr:chalcone isomerase [Tanacetum cinerariifolium]
MILPLTGKQYSEKVSEMCVGVWKAHGTYTDADGATIDKFLEVFKDENFLPGASILFTTSPDGSLTISFSKDGIIPEGANIVLENEKLAQAVIESVIGKHGVSPATKQSLALRLSDLMNHFDEKATADVEPNLSKNGCSHRKLMNIGYESFTESGCSILPKWLNEADYAIDRTIRRIKNFPVDGLDHQSVEGASQCKSVDHVDKKSFVMDDHNFKVKDNKESSHSNSFLSTQKIVGVLDLMDVDQQHSLVNNVLGHVHIDSVVKDGDETDVKTVAVLFQHEKKLSKACLSPYDVPPTSRFGLSVWHFSTVSPGLQDQQPTMSFTWNQFNFSGLYEPTYINLGGSSQEPKTTMTRTWNLNNVGESSLQIHSSTLFTWDPINLADP